MNDRIIKYFSRFVIIAFCIVALLFVASLILMAIDNIFCIDLKNEIIIIGWGVAIVGSAVALIGIIFIVSMIKEIWNSTK